MPGQLEQADAFVVRQPAQHRLAARMPQQSEQREGAVALVASERTAVNEIADGFFYFWRGLGHSGCATPDGLTTGRRALWNDGPLLAQWWRG